MAKYKRADLMEEEDSVNMDHHIDNHAKVQVLPIQPRGLMNIRSSWWKSRTLLEKSFIILSLVLFFAFSISVALILRGRHTSHFIYHHDQDEYCLSPSCIQVASQMLDSMDFNTDPCKDFYQYACGGWIIKNPIPDGKSSWGTFQKLWKNNQLIMKIALEDKSNSQNLSLAEKKAQEYYTSCIDKEEIEEKLGGLPLIELLATVGGWSVTGNFSIDSWKFQTQLQKLHNDLGMGGLFSWAVGDDDKNSTKHIIQIDQGGLALPTREYYLNETHQDVLKVYLDYMIKVGQLLGAKDENKTRDYMKDVLEFEKEIANITSPPDERRDDEKLYHAMNITQLQALSPFISWPEYLNNAFEKVNRKIGNDEVIVVYAADFMANISKLVTRRLASKEGRIVINNYMVWHLVKTMTCCLSKAFKDADKALRKAILGSDGTEENWRTCVSDTNNNLGFAVGAMFIQRSFHDEARPQAKKMIDGIRNAFKNNLANLRWMDEDTRVLAREKADAIENMLGYPDFILDSEQLDKKYEELNINVSDYFGNNLRVNQFTILKNLEKLDKPVNKSKWGMTPPTVNAYYTPTSNQVVIPAGILQQPFFDPRFPKSVNFGGIGVVFGHELIHAFDDQGREYDKDGNMHAWWKNETIDKFKKQTECVIDQYSNYKIESHNIDGKNTLGENIADNGGLKAAFNAYLKGSRDSSRELPLPGLNMTHNQVFFLSFAQVWCSSSLKETTILQLENDPHVPASLRVRGPLSNFKAFSESFNCPLNSEMNPPKKCEVW